MDTITIKINYGGGVIDEAELAFEPYEDEEMEALELPYMIEEYVDKMIKQRVRWVAERKRNAKVIQTFSDEW